MDAFEFYKEFRKMCAKHHACQGCPMQVIRSHRACLDFSMISDGKFREICAIVEKWSKEHPVKTMTMDFFEKFPKAPKRRDGLPECCPNMCGYCEDDCANFSKCIDCWNRPLEE